MRRSVLPPCLLICALLPGCASTKVETSGTTPDTPLCQARGESLSALVLWRTDWRPDQKEVPLREAAARDGIEDFFASSACFTTYEVRRLSPGASGAVPSASELLALAATASPSADRVIVVTVRELGPVVKLFNSAALVEGGTEVVLGLDAIEARTGASLASFQTHWQNGGPMVIKGVASLPQDMSAALRAALSPVPGPP